MKISRMACVAVSLGLLGAGPAFAADENVSRADSADYVATETINVLYYDLDLAKNKDAKILFLRLKNAAQDICGDTFDAASLSERIEVDQCQKDAIAGAVEKVNRPLLTAVFDRHYDVRRGQG